MTARPNWGRLASALDEGWGIEPMADDRDRDLDVQNARLLSDLDQQQLLRPCASCGWLPAIHKDQAGRPMIEHRHAPDCAVVAFADAQPAAESSGVPPEQVEADWAAWQAHNRRSAE